MKRLKILFFGISCVILSYAFSYASELHCEMIQKGGKVKIAWDAVTKLKNGEDIYSHYPESYAIGYLLYHSDKKDLIERNREIKGKPDPDPIPETYSTIRFFTKPCQNYIGVRTAIYRDKKLEGPPVAKSETISWSDNPLCTGNKPFAVEVQK